MLTLYKLYNLLINLLLCVRRAAKRGVTSEILVRDSLHRNHIELFTHSISGYHGTRKLRRLLYIIGCPCGNLVKDNLLSGTSTCEGRNLVLNLLLVHKVFITLLHLHCVAERAAYQGVEGAFAHIALRALFPHAEAVSCPTWDEVFAAVERGDAAHGVVPFENSHAGDVSAVLDLCYNHPDLWVVDVYDLPISQNLLVLPGTQLAEIRSVYSHQQAIAQSETFLKQFHLPATAMLNTAMAAKFVAESGDKTKAAIASAETAALYGLEVLVPRINTDGDNTTRFIVISRQKPTAGNRFSLLFTVDNKPGKLAEVIQVIGASGFNMESIKSRPMPHVPFEYYFYVELVGDPTADETGALLHELDRTCRTVRLLGVYTK